VIIKTSVNVKNKELGKPERRAANAMFHKLGISNYPNNSGH